MKTKRAQAFDRKRASRFEAQGARVDNITQATVGLVGKDAAKCALCDHNILWQFVLHLSLSTGRNVTFNPVGSSCIESWADSLPVSDAQRSILEALKLAVEEANEVKARFRSINADVKGGKLSREQGDALIAFWSAPTVVREHEFLLSVAEAVDRFSSFKSDKQWGSFERVLKATLASAKRKSDRLARQDDGEESEEDKLFQRADAVIESGQADAYDRGDTLVDIVERGKQRGLSDGQRRFLYVLLREAEAVTVESASATTPPSDSFATDLGEQASYANEQIAQAIEDEYDDLPF